MDKESNRYFIKEDMLMATRPMKRCSTFLVIWKVHIYVKITVRYHFILTEMVTNKETYNTKCW